MQPSDPMFFLVGLVILSLFIPSSLDPAIRIKEWQIRKGIHPESRHKDGSPHRPGCKRCRNV